MALSREGRTLDEEEVRALLNAERPRRGAVVASPSAPMPALLLLSGPSAGLRYEVQAEATIGRSPSCEIPLPRTTRCRAATRALRGGRAGASERPGLAQRHRRQRRAHRGRGGAAARRSRPGGQDDGARRAARRGLARGPAPGDASHLPVEEVLPHVGTEAAVYSAGVTLLGATSEAMVLRRVAEEAQHALNADAAAALLGGTEGLLTAAVVGAPSVEVPRDLARARWSAPSRGARPGRCARRWWPRVGRPSGCCTPSAPSRPLRGGGAAARHARAARGRGLRGGALARGPERRPAWRWWATRAPSARWWSRPAAPPPAPRPSSCPASPAPARRCGPVHPRAVAPGARAPVAVDCREPLPSRRCSSAHQRARACLPCPPRCCARTGARCCSSTWRRSRAPWRSGSRGCSRARWRRRPRAARSPWTSASSPPRVLRCRRSP